MHAHPNQTNRLIEAGDERLKADDLTGAEKYYKDALAIDGSSAEALWSVGCVVRRRGDHAGAQGWAQRALAVEPDHRGALFLLAGSLLRLNQYEEALKVVEQAGPGEQDPVVMAEIGLWQEKLGRYAESEAALRSALEQDPSYQTRNSLLALHTHNPFFAPLHVALARVLQKQGNKIEARLHYHLARRVDAEVEIDPLYLEIMTEDDLENHSFYDAPKVRDEPSADADLTEKLIFVASVSDYRKLVDSASRHELGKRTPEIAALIRVSQEMGEFSLAAKFRLIGDVASGEEAVGLWNGLKSRSWLKLLEIAQAWAADEIDEGPTLKIASRIEVELATVPDLLALARRFVRLQPQSGRYVAAVVRASLLTATESSARVGGNELWGYCCLLLRRFDEASAVLSQSAADVEAGLGPQWAESVFTMLSELKNGLGEQAAAEDVARRFEQWSRTRGAATDVIAAEWLLARILAEMGRTVESHAAAARAAELIEVNGASDRLRAAVLRHLEETAPARQRVATTAPSPASTTAVPRDEVEAAIAAADSEEGAGNVDAAVQCLRRAQAVALDSRRFADIVRILTRIGYLQLGGKRLEDAKTAFREALIRSEGLGPSVTTWPILAGLSSVAEAKGDAAETVQLMEQALAQARREQSTEGKTRCHEDLARLLIETDPERAIEHYGHVVKSKGSQKGTDRPDVLVRADAAFRANDFVETISLFESWLSTASSSDPNRGSVMTNLALAKYRVGDANAAIQLLQSAADLLVKGGDPAAAIDVLARFVQIHFDAGQDVSELLGQVERAAGAVAVPGLRRSCLVKVANAAVEVESYAAAERAAQAALTLATNTEWRDLGDEMECRKILGRTFRSTGRYQEAVDQYSRALDIAKRLSDEPEQGIIIGWRAVAFRYLHRLDESLEDYAKAIEISLRYGNRSVAAGHRFNMASVLLDLGRRDKALKAVCDALAAFEAAGARRYAQRALMMLSHAWQPHELPPDIVSRVASVADEAATSSDASVQSWALTMKAMRLMNQGQRHAANALFEEALALRRKVGDRYNLACTYLARARALVAPDPEQSRQDAGTAAKMAQSMGHRALRAECLEFLLHMAIIEDNEEEVELRLDDLFPVWLELRSTLRSDADRIHFADEVAHSCEGCAKYFLDKGRPERTFELLEWAGAQALSDIIASQAAQPDTSKLDTQAGNESYAREPDERGEPQFEPLRRPVLAKAVPPLDFSGTKELLSTCGHNAVLVNLSYVGGELIGLIHRAGQSRTEVARTGLSRSELAGILHSFRQEMHGEMRGAGALTWLQEGARIVCGLAPYIERDDRVIFVVEEELQVLPLAGLELADGETLAERATVSYGPSATVLRQIADRKAARSQRDIMSMLAIGIAYPEEALAVRQFFPGMALTGNAVPKDTIREVLAGKSIVHISSHGHFNPVLPLESGIHLRSSGSDLLADVLSVRDLSRWRIDCDLVTLSACESGVGQAGVSEFLGLTRNLLAAGVDAVIAALWPVDSKATMRFMLEFYADLREQSDRSAEIDIAQALRTAQVRLARESAYANWAAFKLIGWPKMTLTVERTGKESDAHA